MEIGEIFWLAAEMGELGEEVKMALVVTGKEKKESVDGLIVERAIFDGLFGEEDGDDIV